MTHNISRRQLLGITCLPQRVTAVAIDNIQDEQHVISQCTHPLVVSLLRRLAPLSTQTGLHDVSAF